MSTPVEIGNESAPIQMTQCRFPGMAISSAKILIYLSNKICGNNFIKQHSETVMIWNYQNADCSLRKKYCVIRYNFRHTFVPYLYRAVIFKLNNIEQKSKVIWRRDASPLNRLIVGVSNCKASLFGDAWESVTTCVRACIWNADGLRNRESAKNGHWTVCCTQVSDVKHKIFAKCQASVLTLQIL